MYRTVKVLSPPIRSAAWAPFLLLLLNPGTATCGEAEPVAANGQAASSERDERSTDNGHQAVDEALRPQIVIAEHVLLWNGEIVTWEEVLQRMRAARPRGPLHPTFHSTHGVHHSQERNWQYWHDKVFEVYGELFEPAGVTFSSVTPRGSRRYDKIRTAEDLQPDPALARTGRVSTPDGEPAQGAQVVVLPVEDVLGVALSGKRLRDPLDETWAPTDESGRFTVYPEEETYLLAVLHDSGFCLRTLGRPDDVLQMKLEPWATLTFTSTGELNGQSASVAIRPRGGPAEGPGFRVYEVETDGEPVTIPVPAGTISVQRTLDMGDGTSIGLPAAAFDLAPGENNELAVTPATIQDELRAFELYHELESRRSR